MPYQLIEYSHIQHPVLKKVLLHSDMMLHDLYQVFKIPAATTINGGAGNFSIAAILLCIIDGIAGNLYPTKSVKKQEARFKRLIRDKMYWSPKNKGWLEKDRAAKQFYLELRNPLVHELGADISTSARIDGHLEPRIGKWGSIPAGSRDIDQIQCMDQWNDEWPILGITKDEHGREFVTFSGAAMWWAVKKMIVELINDRTIIQAAAARFSP